MFLLKEDINNKQGHTITILRCIRVILIYGQREKLNSTTSLHRLNNRG